MSEPVLSRKALISTLEDRAEVKHFYQNRPYSFVYLTTWYNDREYEGYGFSKCMYPDKFDCELGMDIAKRRALYMVYHQIRANERGQRRMAAWDSLIEESMVINNG